MVFPAFAKTYHNKSGVSTRSNEVMVLYGNKVRIAKVKYCKPWLKCGKETDHWLSIFFILRSVIVSAPLSKAPTAKRHTFQKNKYDETSIIESPTSVSISDVVVKRKSTHYATCSI